MIWFSSIVLKDTSTLLQGPRFKPDMRACVCVCVCAYARDREWRVEQRGDSRLLKNWWVARGHVSPKVISCCDTHPPRWLPVINIITSCSGEEAKVGAFFYLRQRWLCQDSLCTDQKNGECVFVKGMRGFYGIVQWIIHAEKCLSLLIIQL